MSGRSVAQEPPTDRWVLDAQSIKNNNPLAQTKYVASYCFVDPLHLNSEHYAIESDLLNAMDPMVHVLLHSGRQAVLDAEATNELPKDRTGIIIGNIALPTDASSALGDEHFAPMLQTGPAAKIHPHNRYVTGLPVGVLAQALGVTGQSYTLDAACASSLYAIKLAADELRAGRADAMIAGGLSRPDCLYTQMGFSQLQAL